MLPESFEDQKETFEDYYETLQLSPNAQPETVQRVYRLLAQMYHPDNLDTGNKERFEEVLSAYKVLSNPERRAAYDVAHRRACGLKWKSFDQASATVGFEAERCRRLGILSVLRTKRMNTPDQPSLNVIDLEQLLGCPREHLQISVWYLRESGRISAVR
jgi:curved DNA-binding protein CbpA